jgi:hypothetical protein
MIDPFSHNPKIKKKDETGLDVKAKENLKEYNRYMEKLKLEKIKKEEKQKFEQDLIRMEKYAEGIYTFILKRKFLRKLVLNVELNKVVFTFMEVIYSKIMKQRYLSIMKDTAIISRNKRERTEQIKLKFAINFYNKQLIRKGFKMIYDDFYVTTKLSEHYVKKMWKVRLLNYKKIIFKFFIDNYNHYTGSYKVKENKILIFRKVRFLNYIDKLLA